MKLVQNSLQLIAVLAPLIAGHPALAGLPTTLDYQAFLTDSGGTPVDGAVNITFSLYNVDVGGLPLWTDMRAVTVEQGVFSVELGTPLNPFPVGQFETPLWLGITVGADAEMLPRRPLTSTGFAFKAQDANTLDGVNAASLDQSMHVGDTGNPHNVNATQVGAVAGTELVSHAADASAHHQKTTRFADLVDNATDAQIPDDITIELADNADTVDGLNASSTPAAGQLLALDGGGKFPNSTLIMGPGSGLNADLLDGEDSTAFLKPAADFGRFGVASELYEGMQTLAGKYVNTSGDTMTGPLNVAASIEIDGIGLPGNYGPDPAYVGTDGNYIAFGHLGISEDFIGYANNRFYFMDSPGGGDSIAPDIIIGGKVGIGTTTPEHKLHVNGLAKFELNQGSIAMSTPGGNPGLIAYASNGNRRDMTIQNGGLSITVSNGATAPANTDGIYISENGYVGFGTMAPAHRVDVNGRVRTGTLEITGGADLSEQFNITDSVNLLDPLPGMVVSIDPDHAGALVISDHAYNRRVAGIISGAGDVRPGMIMGHSGTIANGAHPVALSGRVYCLAETSGGAIAPGDLLTTSGIPGYAMKVTDYERAQGAIIGKAMTRLDEEKGEVLVLVTLQ